MTTRLIVAARTDVGRVRKLNEDAILVADLTSEALNVDRGPPVRFEVGARGALLAVADGMGGHAAGDVASALTLASLHRTLFQPPATPDPDVRVQGAVEVANLEVYRAGREDEEKRRMGSTLTAVLIDGAVAHIAEIGDSRAYVLRNGEIRQVTHDQSLVQTMIDKGALTPEQGETSTMRNVLTQAIGQSPSVGVAITTLALRRKDCLLLCSDGLWSKLTMAELRDVVLASPSLDAACERMVALANERGGEDNVTVILAGVSGDVPAVDPGERITGTFHILSTFEPAA